MRCDMCKNKWKTFTKSYETRSEFENELSVYFKSKSLGSNEKSLFLVEFKGFMTEKDDVHPFLGTIFTKWYDADLSVFSIDHGWLNNAKELFLDAALQIAQGFSFSFFKIKNQQLA